MAGEVTQDLYQDHLNGDICLGITPIMDGNCCSFGAIDIDMYDGFDHSLYAKRIIEAGLPLVPCRTKSGGLHCYMFTSEPIPAKLMRDKLRTFSAFLGFAEAEVFPKQVAILSDKGDTGSWINLPYFDQKQTDRYGIKEDGSPMTLAEFFAYAKIWRWSLPQVEAFHLRQKVEYDDAPPCLQQMMSGPGISEGGRNKALFALGIYFKKKMPKETSILLDNANQESCIPPLTSKEMVQIKKSIIQGVYGYSCGESPLKNHCDKATCRTRKFGTKPKEVLLLQNLVKYNSVPPIWFLDIDEVGRIEINDTEVLQNQNKFQKTCMEKLNIMPLPMRKEDWLNQMRSVLENCQVIQIPMDATATGMFNDLVESFCLSKAQARTIEDTLAGKPYCGEDGHYFRLSALWAYLERAKFRDFGMNKVSHQLKELGCQQGDHTLLGRMVSLWKAPLFEKPKSGLHLPHIEDKEVF